MNFVTTGDRRFDLSLEAKRLQVNGLVASKMEQVIRNGASAIRAELMALCREVSLDQVDECERQILAYFGPERSVACDAVTDITHDLKSNAA
jgi:hypothetical protein